MKIELAAEHARALTFQSYAAQPQIEGVLHKPLKKHRALEGFFMEHLRLTGGKVEGLGADFEVRQVSVSRAAGGRINAFHVHPKRVQDEIWTVVDGALAVWLIDVRDGSETVGARRQVLLTGEAPALLYIPAGVAHGYQAAAGGATLIYAMNGQFDASDPNEGRLPWDVVGRDLWEADRG